MAEISKADRDKLAMLSRKRAKVAKSMIGERAKVLRADVEDQLSAEFKVDDQLWADLTRHARAEVTKADQRIAEICHQIGIPEDLRPSLQLSWRDRGENMLASRRSELRKLASARIDAAGESAKVAIDAEQLRIETELVRDGLDSAEAVAYLDNMPTVEQLMPPVDVAALAPSRRRVRDDETTGRYSMWEPPTGTAGQLLTPSSASTREAKRQAIAAALTANPEASDRRIAEIASVDGKTVAKYRAKREEIRSGSAEIPTDGEVSDE